MISRSARAALSRRRWRSSSPPCACHSSTCALYRSTFERIMSRTRSRGGTFCSAIAARRKTVSRLAPTYSRASISAAIASVGLSSKAIWSMSSRVSAVSACSAGASAYRWASAPGSPTSTSLPSSTSRVTSLWYACTVTVSRTSPPPCTAAPTTIRCSCSSRTVAPTARSMPRRYLKMACSRSTTSSLRCSAGIAGLPVPVFILDDLRKRLLAGPSPHAQVPEYVWGRAAVAGDAGADVDYRRVPDRLGHAGEDTGSAGQLRQGLDHLRGRVGEDPPQGVELVALDGVHEAREHALEHCPVHVRGALRGEDKP